MDCLWKQSQLVSCGRLHLFTSLWWNCHAEIGFFVYRHKNIPTFAYVSDSTFRNGIIVKPRGVWWKLHFWQLALKFNQFTAIYYFKVCNELRLHFHFSHFCRDVVILMVHFILTDFNTFKDVFWDFQDCRCSPVMFFWIH